MIEQREEASILSCHHSECPPFFTLVLLLSMTPHGVGCPFGQPGPAVLAVSSPRAPSAPGWQGSTRSWAVLWVSPALQQLKHRSVINVMLIPNPRHSTKLDTRQNINCIPAKTRTSLAKSIHSAFLRDRLRDCLKTLGFLFQHEHWARYLLLAMVGIANPRPFSKNSIHIFRFIFENLMMFAEKLSYNLWNQRLLEDYACIRSF